MVEPLGHQFAGDPLELGVIGVPGRLVRDHVALEVEVGVLVPEGGAIIVEDDPLAQPRHALEPLRDPLADLGQGDGRLAVPGAEHEQLQRMPENRRVLEPQDRGVVAAEALHRSDSRAAWRHRG